MTEPSLPVPRFALWQLGFRPFYLLASVFGALSVLLWALQFTGWLPMPYLAGPLWHAHEMVFGFALAVVVGFLFTAGRNWTGLPTPTGGRLAALAGVWLLARVLVLTPYAWASALVNAAFPIAAGLALAVPFVRAGNRRNYFFPGLLVMLGFASLAFHLGALGVIAFPAMLAIRLALDVLLFILCVMGGRVIPMFTNGGVPGAAARRVPALENAALGTVLALFVLDAVQAPAWAVAACAGLAALAHLARWLLWQPWRTLRTPLVAVLHAGYAWVPVHLALRALPVAPSLATHALTVGAIGGLVIGMITRTARGHTGRPLRADAWEVACYLLVGLAAVLRVFVPWFAPAWTLHAILAAAIAWCAGFGLYALRYWNVLTRARLDGRPG